MDPLASGILPYWTGMELVAISLLPKAVLILAGAWLLARLSRRASAAVRHGVWAVALVGLVMLPIVGPWLPPLRIDLPRIDRVAASAATARPLVPAPSGTPGELGPATAGGALTTQRMDPPGAARPLSLAREGVRLDWFPILMLGWISGTVLFLVRLGIRLTRVRWLSGHARPETDGPLVRLVEALARERGIRRSVCVLESSAVSMPLTWGVLRPVILLPEESADWPAGRLRVVVLHELAHIRRWDYLTHLAGEIACALYWPVPLVWMAQRKAQAEQELACDDLVLAAGTGSVEYAEHLLAVARSFYGDRRQLGATVAMAREVSLKQRIRTILDDRTNRRPLRSSRGLVALVLLAGFSLPVAALRPDTGEGAGEAATPATGAGSELVASPPAAADAVAPHDEPAAAFLWLEAEDGERRGPMEIREDLGASSGSYVLVPDGDGNDAPDGGSGEVDYTFEAPEAGEYLVWGRVIGEHDNDNSLYLSMDRGAELRWDVADERGEMLAEWGWVPLRAADASSGGQESVRFELSAGVHTLRIRNREDGTRLDRLLVTTDAEYVPSGRGAPAQPAVYRWMEVERAHLTGAIRHDSDDKTSGGQYIAFQRGTGAEGSGTASFTFDVEEAGRYVVWGRVLAPDDGANSLYASLDGGGEVIWDAPNRDPGSRAGWWSWSPLSAREYNGRRVDPLLLDLTPGRHVLRLRTREAGTRLDGILVTNDVAFRPQGIWPAALPPRPARVWLEAESARLDAPLFIRSDSAAAGGLFVEAEPGSPRWDEPDASAPGAAVLRFSVPQGGLYNFWARTLSRHDGEDSFWVRVNGGRWIRWNSIPTSGSWRWSMIHDADRQREVAQFRLETGENLIEFAPREAGARLDQLLITDDPLFDPGAAASQ